MENFGTGIRRIFTLYEGFSKQPQIITTNNSYKITLFNQNYLLYQDNIDEGLLRIVEFLKGNQEASRQEIQNSVKYSKDKTLRLLNGAYSREYCNKIRQQCSDNIQIKMKIFIK